MEVKDEEHIPKYITSEEMFIDKKYLYPNFQRAYSWGKEQINAFLNDLLEKASKRKYYLGTIYYLNNANTYHIVDGQQRITTLFLIINALRIIDENRFNKLNINLSDRAGCPNFDSIVATPYSRVLFSSGLAEIEEQFSNETDVNLTKMQIHLNQKYIVEKISEKSNSYFLQIQEILRNSTFLFLNGESLADSNEIFENINSKGIKLDNTDIIKNAYFSRIKESGGDDFNSQKYKYWITIEKNIFNEKNLPGNTEDFKYVEDKAKKFKTNFESFFVIYFQLKYNKKQVKTDYKLANKYIEKMDSHINHQNASLINELRELKRLSASAKYIFNVHQELPAEEFSSLQRSINFLDNLGISVHHPFSIALYHKIINSTIYRDKMSKLNKLFEKISLFHFNYNTMFSMLPSRVEKAYQSIAHDIYMNDIKFEEVEERLKKELFTKTDIKDKNVIKEKLRRTLFTLDRRKTILKTMTDDEKGEYAIFNSSNEIKYIYEILEKYLRDDHSSHVDIETIEHINNLSDDYTSFKVQNLIPLEITLNGNCKTHGVEDKIEHYKKSKYKITLKFVEIYEKAPTNWEDQWVDYLAGLFLEIILN